MTSTRGNTRLGHVYEADGIFAHPSNFRSPAVDREINEWQLDFSERDKFAPSPSSS